MTRHQNDPRIMKTKFAFTCKSCRCAVSKGDDIVYFPATKTAKCFKCGEKDYNAFIESAIDEDFYNGRPY